ncbi:pyridoxamine 5'-phosphate oxidase family protein [uncultured Ferrimonas sp.]|uniref:pyridoxamine 5'-phosphate oxidase family protein n=1 Tax=uncultured Ferrimonas sp. TaxID=432640 RepID=UPI002621F449|nr:pyridoxamine 5'-phosphate oxidase family protein [uncultured Ferrimonas sp.]
MDQAQKNERLSGRLLPEIEAFKHSRQTLLLASIDDAGLPSVSYAPYAVDEAGFYIQISDLAKHGKNLKQCKSVSVMLLQDEAEAKSVFARKRLTFDVTAEHLSRDSDDFVAGRAALVARFGEMAENLSALGDFNMYRLVPSKGLYVKGFGQAFEIGGADMSQINWKTGEGKGHGHAQPA